MKRLLVAVFVGLAPLSAFAETAYDAAVAKARQAAAAQNHAEAIKTYRSIIKSLPKGDPRNEMLNAELVFAYYGSKDYQKTAKESIRFLTAFPQSQYGFNISYILAAAQFGLDKYAEAFTIFSGFTFEQVRTLEEDPRGKVYEVLIRSLSGMKNEPASQALRADVNDLLRDKDDRPILVGPISAIVELVKTPSDLDRLIEQVPSSSDRERIYALLGTKASVAAGTVEPFVPSFYVGAGVSYDSIVDPTTPLHQINTQLQAGLELPLTPDGSAIGLRGSFDLFPVSGTVAGASFKNFSLDAVIDGRMYGNSKRVSWDILLGLTFRQGASAPTAFGYQSVFGVLLGTELRIATSATHSLGVGFSYRPLAKFKGKLDSYNAIMSVDVDYRFGKHAAYLDLQKASYRETVTTGGFELARLGLGYRLTF